MRELRITTRIEAPPDRVWAIIADASRIGEWQSNVREVKDVSGALEQPGASYTIVSNVAGRRMEGRWEVVRAEVHRLLETTGPAPMGGRMRATNTLEPVVGGTDATLLLEYDLPGGFVGRIADSRIKAAVRTSRENLKAMVERLARELVIEPIGPGPHRSTAGEGSGSSVP